MRPLRALSSIALMAVLASGPALAAPPPPDAIAQRLLDAMREVSGVPGMGAAVWKDGRIAWAGSSGLRDMERGLPVTADTKFRLASVSKMLTVTAAAKLAEEGRLDLDAPVAGIVPEVGKAWPAMNLRQLAAHTAGMPHYQLVDEGRGRGRYASSRDAVKIFAGRPLLQMPGAKYAYSSWGYTLIGAAVEAGSGRHFVDYVTRTVTPGLAIGADFTDGPDRDASHAYELGKDGTTRAAPHDFSYTWAGGGMGATPGAIANFGGRLLDGRIVRPATRELMFTPARLNDGTPVSNDDYQVGFGWRVASDQDGARMAFHNGITVGARSALLLYRDERIATSLLSNALWTSSIDRSAQMLAAPFRNAPATLVPAACPVGARTYKGTFGDAPVSGTARFTVEGGLCTGTLENGGALTAFFASSTQASARPLRIVGLAADGSLPRGGLVTPYGIYDLRAAGGRRYVARLGATRALDIVLSD